METAALLLKASRQGNYGVVEWIIKYASAALDGQIHTVYSQAAEEGDTMLMHLIETRYKIIPQNVPNLMDIFCRSVSGMNYATALQILHGDVTSPHGKFSLSEVPGFIDIYRKALHRKMRSATLVNLTKIAYYMKINTTDAPELVGLFRAACSTASYTADGKEWAFAASEMVSYSIISKIEATDVMQELWQSQRPNMLWLFDNFNLTRADFRDPLAMFREAVGNGDADYVCRIACAAEIKRNEVEDLVGQLCKIMCGGTITHFAWIAGNFEIKREDLGEMRPSGSTLEWAKGAYPDLI